MDLTSRLRAFYAPGVPYEIATPDQPIPNMVLEVASRYPTRAAIDFFARQLSYSELAQDMRRCAGALHQAGVRPGDRVASSCRIVLSMRSPSSARCYWGPSSSNTTP